MSDELKMVAMRIKSLREFSDLSVETLAKQLKLSVETYQGYEEAESDIPVSILYELAHFYNVDLTVLLTGEDPHMESFFVVRKGKGASVNRRKEYGYEALAYGFVDKVMEPFMVTVKPSDQPASQYAHPGHEFVHVLEGELQIVLEKNTIRLLPGDSMYFRSEIPHGMVAVGNVSVRFLDVLSDQN